MRYVGLGIYITVAVCTASCSGKASSGGQSPIEPAKVNPQTGPANASDTAPAPVVRKHKGGIVSVSCPIRYPAKITRAMDKARVCNRLGGIVSVCEIDFLEPSVGTERYCQRLDEQDLRRDEIAAECMANYVASDHRSMFDAVIECQCGPGPGCTFRSCPDMQSCFRALGFHWTPLVRNGDPQ